MFEREGITGDERDEMILGEYPGFSRDIPRLLPSYLALLRQRKDT